MELLPLLGKPYRKLYFKTVVILAEALSILPHKIRRYLIAMQGFGHPVCRHFMHIVSIQAYYAAVYYYLSIIKIILMDIFSNVLVLTIFKKNQQQQR